MAVHTYHPYHITVSKNTMNTTKMEHTVGQKRGEKTEENVDVPVRGQWRVVGRAGSSTRGGGGASGIPLPPLTVTQTCSFNKRVKDRIKKRR